jgi:hypothetical protein
LDRGISNRSSGQKNPARSTLIDHGSCGSPPSPVRVSATARMAQNPGRVQVSVQSHVENGLGLWRPMVNRASSGYRETRSR